jgi:hypothetical protein
VACRSAGDLEVVADVDDLDGHLRGVDDCVVFGSGSPHRSEVGNFSDRLREDPVIP